jgi:hypothetical protein
LEKSLELAGPEDQSTFKIVESEEEEEEEEMYSTICTAKYVLYSIYNFFCGAATQRGPWPPHS